MTWIRYNRGDCPICLGIRKDCRSNNDTGLVHCRDSDANPRDWIFRGLDTWGFGMWAYAPDTEAWSQAKKEQWRIEREFRQKVREREERESRAKSLSSEDRDREIRKILAQLTLSARHRQNLKDRGLSDGQIRDGHYRSVEQWQKLDSRVSDRLAGVKLGGKSLLTPDAGILCPIPDCQGKFTSWQLRQDNNSDAKYIWAASEKKRKHRPTAHLKNGELPLGVWLPQEPVDQSTIGLTEGTGIKPYIASLKLNIPVVGAAGGNFASSPQTLKATLEHLQSQKIILYPDAGSVINTNVLNQYQKLFNLVHSWNYDITIAWWKQVEKGDGDIDEIDLSTSATITHLSPTEFIKLARQQQYIYKLKNSWREFKRFTPKRTIHRRYFQDQLPPSNTATFIKSGLGTGKTTQLTKKWLVELKSTGAIALGYRNTLLLQFCAQSDFYHLHEHNGAMMIDDDRSRIALCVDSLGKFKPENFEGKVLIIDEIVSVIRHLLFSPTIRNPEQIQNLFAEAIRQSDRLICLDGMMADWVVDYISGLCPEKTIETIANTWVGSKAPLNFLLGTIDVGGNLKVNDRSPWLEELLDRAPVPAIATDSQVFAESLDKIMTKLGYKVLRVDSKTVPEDSVKEFLSCCDPYIKKHRPDVLIYTPSAESGVDVSITDYFSHHFCFFFGVLGVDAILQMLGRIRDVGVPKYVWCRQWVSQREIETIRSPIAQKIAEIIDRNLSRDLTSTLSGIEREREIIQLVRSLLKQEKSYHSDCAYKLMAIANYEKSHLRECLLESLQTARYQINPVTRINNQQAQITVKETTVEVKQQNCRDIFTAEDLPESILEKPLAFDANWLQRCKLIKANLKRRLPGIEHSLRWSEEFIYKIRYQDRQFIAKQELAWLLQHPTVAQRMQQEHYHSLCRQYAIEQQIALWKLRSRFAMVKALQELGIRELLAHPEREYSDKSPEILAIWQLGKQAKYREILGKSPGKYPLRYVGSLLKTIGLGWQSKQVNLEGERTRVYRIDQYLLNDGDRVVAIECIQRKWQQYLSEEIESLDWSIITETLNSNSEIPQPQSSSDLESIADETNNVYIPNELSVLDNTNQNLSDCDSPEAIADLADMLSQLNSKEELALLQTVPEFTPIRLQKAAVTLSRNLYQRLFIWATENRNLVLSYFYSLLALHCRIRQFLWLNFSYYPSLLE